jgi:hypothetical protein
MARTTNVSAVGLWVGLGVAVAIVTITVLAWQGRREGFLAEDIFNQALNRPDRVAGLSLPPASIQVLDCVDALHDVAFPGADLVYLDALESFRHRDELSHGGWRLLLSAPSWRRGFFVEGQGVDPCSSVSWLDGKLREVGGCPAGHLLLLPPEPGRWLAGADLGMPGNKTGYKGWVWGCEGDYELQRLVFPFLRRSFVDVRTVFPQAANAVLQRVQPSLDIQMLMWARASWMEGGVFAEMQKAAMGAGESVFQLNAYASVFPLHALAADLLKALADTGTTVPPKDDMGVPHTTVGTITNRADLELLLGSSRFDLRPERAGHRPPFGRMVLAVEHRDGRDDWTKTLPQQGLPQGTRVEFVDRLPGSLWYFDGMSGDGDAYLFYDAVLCKDQVADTRSCRPVPLGGFQIGDTLLTGDTFMTVEGIGSQVGHPVTLRPLPLKGVAETPEALEDKERDIGYGCFAKDGGDSLAQVRFREECLWKGGLWDARCGEDSDCPFFQAGQAGRGGCQNGYCEMPLGVTPLGYTRFKGTAACFRDDDEEECRIGRVAFRGVTALEARSLGTVRPV